MTNETKTRIKAIAGHLKTAFILTCIVGVIVGWTKFIWTCADCSSFWEKIGWVVGSYFAIWLLAYIASIPGVGCIPVKYDHRD